MTFTAVIFAWRKPGTTPQEFKKHYETVHMDLVKELAGSTFPTRHTRYYIQRAPAENAASDSSNAAHPAVTFIGQSSDFDYDSFAELEFEDAARFQEFMAAISQPEAAERLRVDEEQFLDRAKTVAAAVDQVSTTKK